MDYVITNSHMLYINLYFDNKRTLDQVPPKLKEVVEKEVTTNRQSYVMSWAAKVGTQGFTIENVPVQLRADVQNELQLRAKDEERLTFTLLRFWMKKSLSMMYQNLSERLYVKRLNTLWEKSWTN